MTRERIEDFREIVLPFVKKRLLETNYENLGESDAEMFAKDFDEILDLANKALEQESIFDKLRAEVNTMPCAITSMKEIYVNRDAIMELIDQIQKEYNEYNGLNAQ